MRKLFNLIVAVADIVLLVIIIQSVRSAASTGTGTVQDLTDAQTVYETTTETTSESTSVNGSVQEEAKEEPAEEILETEREDTAEETVQDNAEEVIEEVTEETLEEGRTGLIGKIKSGNRGETDPSDPGNFEASDYPAMDEFQWVTYDILHGAVPSDTAGLSYNDLPGTWKGYIITDPDNSQNAMVEQYLKVILSGTEENTEIVLDWHYSFVNAEGKGFEDNALDSVFSGSMDNAMITAYGTGKLELTNFWLKDGKQYASGTLQWPDGMYAVIFMMRP